LDVSENTALTSLSCSNNFLTSLDVSENPALTYLSCSNNYMPNSDAVAGTDQIYAFTGWNDGTYKFMFAPQKIPQIIDTAELDIAAPATGEVPAASAVAGEGFTVTAVSWTPADAKFKGDTQYTVTAALTAAGGYTFTGGLTTANISGQTAAVSDNTGVTAQLTYQFSPTEAATVSDIVIKAQPAVLDYTVGETISLFGLEVTLIYNDDTTKDVAFADFEANGVTTNLADGTAAALSHNGIPIAVTFGEETANTNNLEVSEAGGRASSGGGSSFGSVSVVNNTPAQPMLPASSMPDDDAAASASMSGAAENGTPAYSAPLNDASDEPPFWLILIVLVLLGCFLFFILRKRDDDEEKDENG
jgi:hypothetical protein